TPDETVLLRFLVAKVHLKKCDGQRNMATELRAAINEYKSLQQFYDPSRSPYNWAAITTNLGNAYLSLPDGSDFLTNIKKAKECYEAAIGALNERDFPEAWAGSCVNLGVVLMMWPGSQRA